jgi:hypothetical protein
MEAATKSSINKKIHEHVKKLYKPHTFHKFYVWEPIHYYTGERHVPRTHAHLLPLRTGPTGSYFVLVGTTNFLAISEEDILLEKEEFNEAVKFYKVGL